MAWHERSGENDRRELWPLNKETIQNDTQSTLESPGLVKNKPTDVSNKAYKGVIALFGIQYYS